MTDRPFCVLFLCTGNSARSILAEGLLRARGGPGFQAFSAGSQPKGAPHPMALEVLRDAGIPTDFAVSKSWEMFAGPSAQPLDLIVTVCDSAAAEQCPIWPGHPLTVHWGLPDPATVEGSDDVVREAFQETCRAMRSRIDALLALPLAGLSQGDAKHRLSQIGKMEL